MISSISIWAKGIVIAVIIGTIIEMILPDNKNKKYIKVVIGIYVLFSIISPVVGKSFNLEEADLEKYLFLNETLETNTAKTNSNDESLDRIFQENMVKQIKRDLNNNGYDSNNIKINTDDKYNITSIDISNITEYEKNTKMINTIEINIKDKPVKGIPTSDKDKIIKYFEDTYKVPKENITIT